MNLATLAVVYLLLVVVSIGGPGALISTAQRAVVGNLGWLSAAQFSAVYGLAAAAPGPNIIFLLGLAYLLEGWAGVVVAVTCIVVPLALLAAGVGWAGDRFHRPWVERLRLGLHPVVIGLGAYGAFVAAEPLTRPALLLAAVGVGVLLRTRLNPAIVVLGLAGIGAVVLGG